MGSKREREKGGRGGAARVVLNLIGLSFICASALASRRAGDLVFDPTLGLTLVFLGPALSARLPAAWVAVVAGQAWAGAPIVSALSVGTATVLAAWVGRWLLSRHSELWRPFLNAGEVVSVALRVAAPATLLSLVGCWGMPWEELALSAVRTSIGVLSVVPLAMARRRVGLGRETRMVAGMLAVSAVVLLGAARTAQESPALAVSAITLLLPVGVALASRTGGAGVSLGFLGMLLLASAVGVSAAIRESSPAADWLDQAALALVLGLVGLVSQTLAAASAGRAVSERRLRESEQRLARAAELSHLGYWEYSLEDEKLTWSAGAERVLGPMTGGDSPGLSRLLSRMKSTDARAVEMKIAEAVAKGTPFESAFGFVTASGEERTAVIRGGPRFDARGLVSALTGSIQDVTDQLRQEEALRASQERISSILESMGDAVVSFSPDFGRVLHANRSALSLLGADGELLSLQPEWLVSALKEGSEGFLEELRVTGQAAAVVRLRRPDGRLFWVHARGREFRSLAGEPLRVDLILTDVTREREAAEALELSERRYRRLFETMSQGVLYLDDDGLIVRANDAVGRILGLPLERILGCGLGEALRAVDEERAPLLDDRLPPRCDPNAPRSMLIGAYNRSEYDHRWVVLDWVREEGELPDGARYQVIVTDITRLKRLQDELERMAYTDPLTGLPNLGMFRDRLEHTLQNAERYGETVGVLFVDLDLFKQVNDRYGHHVGDELLREVATRLRATVRRSDTVARLGGDEFVILLSRIREPSDVDVVAAKILRAFEEPFHPAGLEIVCSCSVGGAVWGGGQASATDLVARADEAMYLAKTTGRSGYRRAEFSERAAREMALEAELRNALGEGQIVPHFQPMVSLQPFEVVGAEALARWRHPALGLLQGADFIPIAQRTGLIVPIGLSIVRQAVEQARPWLDARPGFRLAVNVSPRELLSHGFADRLLRELERADFPASALDIEVTETESLEPFEEAVRVLSMLREAGCRVVLDDLGIGHSTLAHLLTLPADGVKVDRCFARQLESGERFVELLRGLLELLDRFGVRTVVEGVETAGQLRALRRAGCRVAQGYALGKPMSAEDFDRLLARGLASALVQAEEAQSTERTGAP
ncbi:MAG: EAL domain-containing protein [Fimbriimonadaceae bacterium]